MADDFCSEDVASLETGLEAGLEAGLKADPSTGERTGASPIPTTSSKGGSSDLNLLFS